MNKAKVVRKKKPIWNDHARCTEKYLGRSQDSETNEDEL